MEAAKAEESPALLRELLIQALMRLLSRCLLFLSTLSSHPVFSILSAATLLAVLYLPRPLLPFLLSPVPISTLLLLAALLRLGSSPPKPQVAADDDGDLTPVRAEPKLSPKVESVGHHQKLIFCDDLVDWACRTGPLDVIYEESEGEGEDDGGGGSPECRRWLQYADLGSRRLGPFGFAYADSDSENEGGSPETELVEGWSSPEELRFRSRDAEEEEGDDMIEIDLEEENLIEIDISGGR